MQIYNNSEFGEIRAMEVDGQAWFVGKDVAEALGYQNTRDALGKHVEDEDRADVAIHDGRQNRNMTIINESGLYSLIMSSYLPRVREFKQWIFDVVLPSLRQDDDFTDSAKNLEISRDFSTDSSLQIFKYNDNDVRTVQIDGEPWWVLKDVCDVLEIENSRDVSARLDADEKAAVDLTDTSSNGTTQRRRVTLINESGLYNVIIRSDKPEANAFRRWVTHEVLPSIRKHGAYMTNEKIREVMNDPDAWIDMMTKLKHEQSRNAQLQLEAEVNAPKVILADAITVTDDTILIRELAKILKGNGIDVGEKRLFEKLREEGYLIKKQGSDYNSPTQMAMELGLFVINEKIIPQGNGRMILCRTPRVTGKGQQYFVNRFLTQNNLKEAL